jgi:3-oxoacyl-[acyl-carrier protein] reductase
VNYFQSADRALAVVREIQVDGGVAFAVQADVRDADSVSAMFAQVLETFGPPRVLVNAAVGEFIHRPISDLGWADFVKHMEYQVKAVLQLCQGVYPHMLSAGGGAIVNILSQATAGVPAIGMADHVSAKNALMGLSKAMAAEWAEHSIRVNMVSPGLARTELTEPYPERVFKAEAAKTPLKRIATPSDIANAVAYLVGDEASFLTGVNLFVSGGQVML